MAIDKNSLIDKLNTIEGLTNDERSALLGLLRSHKKYGLVWEDKPEDVEERLRSELPVLIEDKGKEILSKNPDAPNHILIEGDNLEALTTLAYTHEGKIDVIYIDPPYNTGNQDFVYNDKYVDSEDSYRHSKWLGFMRKRLSLAKNLLCQSGIIFISIDDNEQANLKLLCDEIFGENNFINCISIKAKASSGASGGGEDKKLKKNIEYLLMYAKSFQCVKLDFPKSATPLYSYIQEKVAQAQESVGRA
jgi:adenine-specific DNA-methyltransferase